MKPTLTLLALSLFAFNVSYAAEPVTASTNIELVDFWISAPPPVAKGTAGYGTIRNIGDTADTITHICTEDAYVMLHKTEINNGRAKMLHMQDTVIPPHSELVLEPMSYHLMFSDLAPNRFVEGQTMTLRFEFEQAGNVSIDVPVRSAW